MPFAKRTLKWTEWEEQPVDLLLKLRDQFSAPDFLLEYHKSFSMWEMKAKFLHHRIATRYPSLHLWIYSSHKLLFIEDLFCARFIAGTEDAMFVMLERLLTLQIMNIIMMVTENNNWVLTSREHPIPGRDLTEIWDSSFKKSMRVIWLNNMTKQTYFSVFLAWLHLALSWNSELPEPLKC